MILSQSSKSGSDPLSDVLAVLNARSTRPSRLEAAGEWSLAFPERHRLKFVAVTKGTCWIEIPDHARELLKAGDVCLIGRTAYTLSSHPDVPSINGMQLYEGSAGKLHLNGHDTITIGSGIEVARENAGFLLDMLPVFTLVPRSGDEAASIAAVLKLLDVETARDTIGTEAIIVRLAEVLLVEAIRACVGGTMPTGWLNALADPRLVRALTVVHSSIDEDWTVARLATEVGMSRSAFATLFTRIVGQPPMDYIRSWRMLLARVMLSNGHNNVAQVAFRVGYTSQSAFSHAYQRIFATSPKRTSRSFGLGSSRPTEDE